jgi:putative ABC transport system permease protein
VRLLFVLSARNLLRHRGRSFVVGLILFLGALVMTVGNGVLSGMDRGLSKNITDGFLGHVVVMSDKQEDDNILFLVMGKSIAPLADESGVETVLAGQPGILGYVPVGKNAAMALNEDGGNPSYVYMLGVDWARYRKVFPNNLKALEGPREPGDTGAFLLLPQIARKQSFDMAGTWYHPKDVAVADSSLPDLAKAHRSSLPVRDEMVLMGFSEDNSSTDVRVPIRGVVRYPALNNLWGHFAFVDIGSFRQCMGYVNQRAPVKLDSAQNALLTGDNLDALFGGGDVGAKAQAGGTDSVKAPGGGAWNLVLVRLRPGQDAALAAKRIDSALKASKVPARAVPWNKASGPVGAMAMLIRGALFAFVMLIFVVAAIIVMNTLSMAAMERAGEIGMMRAIGAGRNFVRALFLGETLLLSLIFGGIGIAVGSVAVFVLAHAGLTTDNDFLQMAYGGETFQPFLRGADYLLALAQLLLTSAIAVFYPTMLASGITPLEAIARD